MSVIVFAVATTSTRIAAGQKNLDDRPRVAEQCLFESPDLGAPLVAVDIAGGPIAILSKL